MKEKFEHPTMPSAPDEPEEKKTTRRGFLEDALKAAAALAVSSGAEAGAKPKEKKEIRGNIVVPPSLRGRKFVDLYALFSGIEGVAPERVSVNFNERLAAAWSEKRRFMKRKGAKNLVVERAERELLNEYAARDPQKMSFEEYRDFIGKDIALITSARAIDWESIKRLKGLEPKERELAQSIVEGIDGDDVLAFAMTELCPSTDGDFNQAFFDFVLRHGGLRYLNSLPAVYDDRTSFGPFQFTEYAIFDTPEDRRGASIVNQAVKKDFKIPGSVIYLRDKDHHRAAYYFVADNIVNLVKAANPKEQTVLHDTWRRRKDDLIKIIATSHHGPNAVRSMARRWLADGAKVAFEAAARGRFLGYARKTAANLRALRVDRAKRISKKP